MFLSQIYVAILLGGAAYTDIRYKKIPNMWLIIWWFIGLYYRGYDFIFRTIFICSILFILYMFRFIGAGDIKLISLIFGYLDWYKAGIVVFSGLVIAGLYAFVDLYTKGVLYSRILLFKDFMLNTFITGNITEYYDLKKGDKARLMPIAPWIFIGFIFWRIYDLCMLMIY